MADDFKMSLKSARANKNLTQVQASKLIKVTSNTLRNWERGITSPNVEQARRICEVYELPLDVLF